LFNAIGKKFNTLNESDEVIDPTTINRKNAGLILMHIATYPFGLFRLDLKKQINKMINENLSEFALFIESCAKTPVFLEGFDKSKIDIPEDSGVHAF
jgi:hypothetical protein